MQISIIAIGNKMPAWVVDNCADYFRRMPAEWSVVLVEVAAEKRCKNQSVDAIRRRETQRLLQAVPVANTIVALDERGQSFTTNNLAKKMDHWQMDGRDISFLIGGPDGLDFSVAALEKPNSTKTRHWPDLRWSLSDLTFTHPMVRVILAEQLYRAWSVSVGHPYHRD